MRKRQKLIFVAYFAALFMDSIYLPNDSSEQKTRATIIFIKYIASIVLLAFSPKTLT